MIGGHEKINRISKLDLVKRKWTTFKFDNSASYHLLLHSATLYGDGILLTGVRRTVPFSPGSTQSQSLHVFDPNLAELRLLPTYGDNSQKPGFKKSCSFDLYEAKNTMVLFGGLPLAKTPNAQLYLLNLNSWVWRRPNTVGRAPSLRSRHASSLVGSNLFVYGGDSADPRLYSIDLDGKNHRWDCIELEAASAGFSGRVGPAMAHLGQGRLLIYGGYANRLNSSDLCIVENASLASRRSYIVEKGYEKSKYGKTDYSTEGRTPPGRECPQIIFYHQELLVIGGNSRDGSDYFLLAAEP